MARNLGAIDALQTAANSLFLLVQANEKIRKFSGGLKCDALDEIEDTYNSLNKLIKNLKVNSKDSLL